MPNLIQVQIWRCGDRKMPLPQYMTPGAAGMDLAAALAEPVQIDVGARVLLPTGLAVAIPSGFEGQVRPRSGLAVRSGLTVLNAPGTIDSDYRGEIQVALVNLGTAPAVIEPLDRIAQLIVAPVARVAWELREAGADGMPEGAATVRGSGGFGHTGKGSEEPE